MNKKFTSCEFFSLNKLRLSTKNPEIGSKKPGKSILFTYAKIVENTA